MEQTTCLEAHDVAELAQVGEDLPLKPGRPLFLTGELGGSVILVKSGRVKFSRLSADGKELILALLEPGDLLVNPGDRDFKLSGPLVEALEKSAVLLVHQREFEAFLVARPAAALSVIRLLADRVGALEERIDGMAFQDVRGRLATTLLRLTDSYGTREPTSGVAVRLRMTQQELASLIGASREMVNHALAEWKRQGWIKLQGRSIVIRQPDALTAQAAAR